MVYSTAPSPWFSNKTACSPSTMCCLVIWQQQPLAVFAAAVMHVHTLSTMIVNRYCFTCNHLHVHHDRPAPLIQPAAFGSWKQAVNSIPLSNYKPSTSSCWFGYWQLDANHRLQLGAALATMNHRPATRCCLATMNHQTAWKAYVAAAV